MHKFEYTRIFDVFIKLLSIYIMDKIKASKFEDPFT